MSNWKYFCNCWINLDHFISLDTYLSTRMSQGNKEKCWKIEGRLREEESFIFYDQDFNTEEEAEKYIEDQLKA